MLESLHKFVLELKGTCCVIGVDLPIKDMDMPGINRSGLNLETGEVSDYLRIVS